MIVKTTITLNFEVPDSEDGKQVLPENFGNLHTFFSAIDAPAIAAKLGAKYINGSTNNTVVRTGAKSVPPRRAPVQTENYRKRPPGTIAWEEHLEAYEVYAKKYGRDQSAERLAERAGFGYKELTVLLGHEPKTWEPV